MKGITAPVPFAGSRLDETRHVRAFFDIYSEQYRVLLPFIECGFQWSPPCLSKQPAATPRDDSR
jgi:hypothetical protein